MAVNRLALLESGCQPFDLLGFQPVDISGIDNCATFHKATPELTPQPSQLWIDQPHVGDAVFTPRGRIFRPFQEFQESLFAQRVQAAKDRLLGFFSTDDLRLLARIRITALAIEIDLQGIHQ